MSFIILVHCVGMICTMLLSQYVSKKWGWDSEGTFQMTLIALAGYGAILTAPIKLLIVFMLLAGFYFLYEKLWRK